MGRASEAPAVPIAVVSGGSGYIASEIVKQLLEGGYRVRATVRSKTNLAKVQHLLDLAASLPGTLELFDADLTKDGSFDDAIAGSTYVFHCASPCFSAGRVTDGQKELVDPAVNGTRNVLLAAVKASCVRRVVLTSSNAAIESVGHETKPLNGTTWTEEDWCTNATLDNDAYALSKVTAERVAWQLSKEHDLSLVTINPSLVLGSVISKRTDAESIMELQAVIEGKRDLAEAYIVSVRDVARAHILAAELPHAKGRYLLCCSNYCPPQEVADILSRNLPAYSFKAHKPFPSRPVADNSKVAKDLGLTLAPPEEFLPVMARCLIQLGLVTPISREE